MRSGTTTLHFGPAHPAAHGVLRMVLVLRGEWVVGSVLTLGLLHRGTEKLLETRHTTTSIGYLDRMDYVSMLSNELGYVECLEGLLVVDVAYTYQLHRIVLTEVTRIENHLLNVACHAGDLGCLLSLLWLFEDREALYDVLCLSSGTRMHASTMIPGGMRGVHTSHWYNEMVDIICGTCSRMDILSSMLLSHRV